MSTETPDFETVGQRVRDGIFESSVFRLTVNPPQGWRLLVGRELAQLDPDAIVGLAAADSTAYVILSPEYLPNDIPDSFLESQRGNFFTTLQDQFESISRSDTVEFNVCGKTVKFEHFVTSAPQFQYYCGVELFDDLKIMCSAWSLGSDSDQLRESVRAAVGSVSLIPQQDTDKLRQEELARTDIQSSIGRDFSLRRSVYRNFRTGVVWTRPKSFWKVNPGDAAKQVDPNCELFCENILAGIYLTVVSDELEDLTLDLNSHHSFVIENTFEEDHAVHDTVPQKLMIDGAAALVSEGDDDTDDIPIRYRIITIIRNGWAYQITVSGYTGRMEQYKREVDAAIAGFAFLGRSLKPVNMTPKGIDDLWLGLKLDLSPSSWKPRDVTPPQLRNLGRVVNFQRGFREHPESPF